MLAGRQSAGLGTGTIVVAKPAPKADGTLEVAAFDPTAGAPRSWAFPKQNWAVPGFTSDGVIRRIQDEDRIKLCVDTGNGMVEKPQSFPRAVKPFVPGRSFLHGTSNHDSALVVLFDAQSSGHGFSGAPESATAGVAKLIVPRNAKAPEAKLQAPSHDTPVVELRDDTIAFVDGSARLISLNMKTAEWEIVFERVQVMGTLGSAVWCVRKDVRPAGDSTITRVTRVIDRVTLGDAAIPIAVGVKEMTEAIQNAAEGEFAVLDGMKNVLILKASDEPEGRAHGRGDHP